MSTHENFCKGRHLSRLKARKNDDAKQPSQTQQQLFADYWGQPSCPVLEQANDHLTAHPRVAHLCDERTSLRPSEVSALKPVVVVVADLLLLSSIKPSPLFIAQPFRWPRRIHLFFGRNVLHAWTDLSIEKSKTVFPWWKSTKVDFSETYKTKSSDTSIDAIVVSVCTLVVEARKKCHMKIVIRTPSSPNFYNWLYLGHPSWI